MAPEHTIGLEMLVKGCTWFQHCSYFKAESPIAIAANTVQVGEGEVSILQGPV
jgi:hypothetical protein